MADPPMADPRLPEPPLADPLLTDPVRANFSTCGYGERITCVVDGDTIWLERIKIRIADINTPETFKPDCPAEKALGDQATVRLVQLLNQGPFDLRAVDRDEDRYGRKLRVITRGGQSLGAELVREGLAERWNGHRRNWC
ncbi:thermonuclease family protein [Pontixanthobacter sp.]|uniref:thermonuclease family protein n=1 Tax=Pontixanthobacter sp. TaxID=2792078 RepID=UPI003C7EC19C